MCVECEFCHKMLSCEKALKIHQARTKACLALREDTITIEEYICDHCDKNFTSPQGLSYHIKSCKNMIQDIKDKVILLEKEIENYKKEEENHKKEVENKNEEIKRLSNLLEKALLKPTISNSVVNDNRSTNVVNFLKEINKPITLSTLMYNVRFLTMNHCIDGGDGLARYYIEHPFKEAPIICTDSSRKNFSYCKKSHGVIEVVKDKKLCKLNPKFFEAIMEEVEHNITKHMKIEGYDINNSSDQLFIAKYLGIINDVKASARGVETKVSIDLINSLANRTGIDIVRSIFSGNDFESDDENDGKFE